MNGFIIATVLLATWALLMHVYYMPRFRRFIVALRIADATTWAAIGSPDGTMFGSPTVPAWGRCMRKYVWRRQYEKVGNSELRLAGEKFRSAMIAVQIGMSTAIALGVIFAFSHF
jgi:hypothetical protein